MRQPLLPLLPGETQMEDHPQPQTMWQKISTYRTMVHDSYTSKPVSHWILLLLSSASMLVAFPASSLFSRIYFANGGKSKWIMSWAAVAGWPIAALILVPTYLFLGIHPTPLDLRLAISYLVLGFLSAADNLMYAYAYAYLPASTAALVASTSLVFSAFFGFILVKNKVNASVVNSVVIITAAMVIVALDSSSDRYGHVTGRQYALGFLWDVVGSALHGLIFALSELVFLRLLSTRSFHVVLEQQLVVSLVGFAVTTVGTVVSGDFGRMRSEAAGFAGGESWYYQVIVWSVLTFQVGVLGSTAVVFLGSTVLAGVLNAIRVPITNIAAVALLNDPMSGFKIISLVITFWGFGSYIYGSYSMKGNHISQQQETL